MRLSSLFLKENYSLKTVYLIHKLVTKLNYPYQTERYVYSHDGKYRINIAGFGAGNLRIMELFTSEEP